VGHHERRSLAQRALGLLALANGQVGDLIEAVDPLVVDAGEVGAQHVMHAPIAKAPAHQCDGLDTFAEQLLLLAHGGRVAVGIAA